MEEKEMQVLLKWKCRYDQVYDMPIEILGTTLDGRLTSITGISSLNLETGFAETELVQYKLIGKGQRMILIDIDEYSKWEQEIIEMDRERLYE
jgi:hypothetical protein